MRSASEVQARIQIVKKSAFAALLGFILAIWMLHPWSISRPIHLGAQRAARLGNLVELRGALIDFRNDHGRFPSNLSALVPQYIPATNLEIFFGPSIATNGLCLIPRGTKQSPESIDQFGNYLYFGEEADMAGFVVVERAGVWKTGADRELDGSRYAVDSDLTVAMIPATNLQSSLKER